MCCSPVCAKLSVQATTLAHMDHSPSVVLFKSIQRKAVEVKRNFNRR